MHTYANNDLGTCSHYFLLARGHEPIPGRETALIILLDQQIPPLHQQKDQTMPKKQLKKNTQNQKLIWIILANKSKISRNHFYHDKNKE